MASLGASRLLGALWALCGWWAHCAPQNSDCGEQKQGNRWTAQRMTLRFGPTALTTAPGALKFSLLFGRAILTGSRVLCPLRVQLCAAGTGATSLQRRSWAMTTCGNRTTAQTRAALWPDSMQPSCTAFGSLPLLQAVAAVPHATAGGIRRPDMAAGMPSFEPEPVLSCLVSVWSCAFRRRVGFSLCEP